jgi:hypothetical protein
MAWLHRIVVIIAERESQINSRLSVRFAPIGAILLWPYPGSVRRLELQNGRRVRLAVTVVTDQLAAYLTITLRGSQVYSRILWQWKNQYGIAEL